jgi:hypothetical protein
VAQKFLNRFGLVESLFGSIRFAGLFGTHQQNLTEDRSTTIHFFLFADVTTVILEIHQQVVA